MRTLFFIIFGVALLASAFAAGSIFPEYAYLIKKINIFQQSDQADTSAPYPSPGINPTPPAEEALQSTAKPEASISEVEKPAEIKAQTAEPEFATPQDAPNDRGSQVADEDEDLDEEVIKGNIAKGDTPRKLFGEWTSDNLAEGCVKALQGVFPASGFKIGQPYTVWRDPQGSDFKKFEYEVDLSRLLVVQNEGGKVTAAIEPIKYDIALHLVSSNIENNLFQAVTDKGEKPSLALLLAEIFGWEINFIRDVQPEDSFSVLLEKRYRDGVFKGYGKVLGASFINKGRKYEAFLFKDSTGAYRHFNPKGENLKKTLLQAPLPITRVTSVFSKARRHPIFGGTRQHFGVDYAAPTGTPVKAVGAGKIAHRGWVGGYGHQLIVKHSSGLESMYSHLSAYAKNIKEGVSVRQGQVIGFVGSTGYSTGPHLDFRLKQGGKFINPQKAVNPRAPSVAAGKLKEFAERQKMVRAFMDGKADLQKYDASK